MRITRHLNTAARVVAFILLMLVLLPTFALGAAVALPVGGFLMGYDSLRRFVRALIRWIF